MNLSAYKIASLQDMLQILNQFEGAGISDIRFVRQRLHDHLADTLAAAMAEHRAASPRSDRIQVRSNQRISPVICRECGAAMQVSPVNISRCTKVGGGYTTAAVCSNPECMLVEYR